MILSLMELKNITFISENTVEHYVTLWLLRYGIFRSVALSFSITSGFYVASVKEWTY